MDRLNLIIEALLFAAGRVVSADEIREVVTEVLGEDGPGDAEIAETVADINSAYESSKLALRIHEWAGGYRMATIPEVAPYLQVLFTEPPRRMTRSLLETLSIIAYRQPVAKPEIDNVRGVDSSYGLRRLMEQGFVAMVGRADTVGRPLLFGTTQRFLEEFGLASLDELPKLREAEELFQDDQLLALNRERIESDEPQNESPTEARGKQTANAPDQEQEEEQGQEQEWDSKSQGAG